ncbi:MAG: aminopeptidase P family protein [Candidatus Omnitrophica bacterium]|nr:aminopeptidase P family protein [Candidatus Omnitrophota bacterium]
MDHAKRLRSLISAMKARSLDALLVTDEANVTYLSGFKGQDSMLLVTPRRKFFITDSRYSEEAADTLKGFSIEVVRTTAYDTLRKLIRKSGSKRVGFESMDLPYEVAARLKAAVKPGRFMGERDMVEKLRAIKDPEEIALIRRSVSCAKKTFNRIVRGIRPGVTEEEIHRRLEIEFIRQGARSAFAPIVAAGKNSSKPHAHSGRTAVPKNGMVMIDIGCSLDGYNSDLTRMLFLGKIGDRLKKIYGIVRAAQEKALALIKPGVRISDVDRAARGLIEKAGHGGHFGHALGHGIGLSVHEYPSISGRTEARLAEGMVFTVEPAIYIPALGGVRIEDMVLVTKDGSEILTR